MNESDALAVIIMRVRVHIGLVAMRRPPGVAQSYVVFVVASALERHSLDAIAAEAVAARELGAHKLSGYRVDSHYAAGVVAPGLQDLEALDADLSSQRLVSYVTYDSTALGRGMRWLQDASE